MLLIGIDWADDHHDAAFMDEPGNILEEFRFSHDVTGFELLHERIKYYEALPSQVLVAIETKHGLLVHDLVRSEYGVYALNPKAVNRYSVPKKGDEIFESIKRKTLKADRVAAAAGKMKLKALADQIVVLRSARKDYEREIKQLLDLLPEADIISSLPGVGKRLIPEITAKFGPNMKDAPKRFEQARDLTTLAGLAPVTKRSRALTI